MWGRFIINAILQWGPLRDTTADLPLILLQYPCWAWRPNWCSFFPPHAVQVWTHSFPTASTSPHHPGPQYRPLYCLCREGCAHGTETDIGKCARHCLSVCRESDFALHVCSHVISSDGQINALSRAGFTGLSPAQIHGAQAPLGRAPCLPVCHS